MKIKTLLIGLAVAFQVLAVAAMAISREWILATGESYTFQTAPVDPRDIFRGDYVRLDYLFSNVPVQQLEEEILERGLDKGQKVYLSLRRDGSGITRGGRLHASPPKGEPYLTGRSMEHWPYRRYRSKTPEQRSKQELWPVAAKYGIEQYYVQQGAGRELEAIRGSRDTFQVPMLIHAGISASGDAVIRSFEWANIATKTEVAQSPERDAADEQSSAILHFTVKNRSDRSLNLPLKPGNCSFILIPAQRAPQEAMDFAHPRSNCAEAPINDVHLAPGETHLVTFDLNQPHWHIMYKNKPQPMGQLPWSYRYRIQYQGETIPGVRAILLSRAFHGRGSID